MKYTLPLFSLLGILQVRGVPPAPGLELNASDDPARGVVTVKIGNGLFTELHYRSFAKPVLFPVIGPTGTRLTRQWPMVAAGAPGEAKDHPHHKGLWFTHGAVNGEDFWSESSKAGKIIVTGQPKVTSAKELCTIETSEEWKSPEGKTVCSSATTITCGLDGDDRFIDYTITINAGEGDVTFGDTKEGTMGIRTHPALNLKGEVAAGHAINSEGQRDADLWGKHARWVDYSGSIDGKLAGVACFDHPKNLRHPTTWHARDYGLIAANPFGLHDFENKPKGAGDHTIRKGESLTLKYRWLFHTGDTAAAKIDERWKKWAGK